MWRGIAIIGLCICALLTPVSAASRTVEVSPSEVEYINVNGKVIGCTFDAKNRLVVGPSIDTNRIRNSKTTWKSVAKKARKASGSKKTKLVRKAKKLKKKFKLHKSSCEEHLESGEDSGGDSGGGGSSGGGGTGEANFDSSGDVTETGRIVFGIPNGVNANVLDGQSTFNEYCVGCHAEERGRTFSEYRLRIAQAPMFFNETEIPDDVLADITAYLNRFNLR